MNAKTNRRDFLRTTALLGGGAALLGASELTPLFARGPLALGCSGPERVLVVVQLSGGNDGLSMVVPHGDDAYHQARRITRHAADSVLRLDDHVGLNPGMTGLKALWDQGELAVVQGCSYPKPNRSHFESMDIWHSADPSGATRSEGWLGRYADGSLADVDDPNLVVGIGGQVLLALRAKKVKPVAFRNPLAYRYAAKPEQMDAFEKLNEVEDPAEAKTNLDFLRAVSKKAKHSSYRIRRAVQGYRPSVDYGPGAGLGADLRVAASLISAGLPTRVIYCTMGGFDTHVQQRGRHDNLMRQLSAALSAFHRDVAAAGHGDRVVTMVFSEFGRRVAENASGGTDHGVAGPMLLCGKGVTGGLYGKHPSLTDLERGDMKMTTDFRAVYAAVLEDWMKAPARPVLGSGFGPKLPKLLA